MEWLLIKSLHFCDAVLQFCPSDPQCPAVTSPALPHSPLGAVRLLYRHRRDFGQES